MSTDDRDHDHEQRILELKEQAKQAGGGAMLAWESEELSLRQREDYWQRIVDIESAPLTTTFQQLLDAGVELPEPDAIDDEQINAKLWEVIGALARMNVFLSSTDHLSDRELYATLWRDTLRDEIQLLPYDPSVAQHLDVLGGCSEEDIYLDMKYYADEATRRYWLEDFPDYDMPAHEDPPFDRDRQLPVYEYPH